MVRHSLVFQSPDMPVVLVLLADRLGRGLKPGFYPPAASVDTGTQAALRRQTVVVVDPAAFWAWMPPGDKEPQPPRLVLADPIHDAETLGGK